MLTKDYVVQGSLIEYDFRLFFEVDLLLSANDRFRSCWRMWFFDVTVEQSGSQLEFLEGFNLLIILHLSVWEWTFCSSE
jgi:hypothetical protein